MRKKKFPITVYVKTPDGDMVSHWKIVNAWTNENIGKYRECWFCPSGKAPPHYFAYCFKTKEDAILFKLAWG